jgi:RNA 3'-terminal phosphate cyclase (ATP)
LVADDRSDPLLIEGAHGEGGGQILRSALALPAITGRPIRIERVRADRRKAGVKPVLGRNSN